MVFSVRPLQALLVGGLAQIVLAEEKSWKEERLEAYVDYTFVIFAVAVALVLLWRIPSTWIRHRRQKCTVNANAAADAGASTALQSSAISAAFKKHVLYAPIFRRRKNRDMVLKPSSKINLGTLPTRLEATFILAYVAVNIIFVFVDVDYTAKTGSMLYSIRNRAGAVATANMVPLFLLATRNNPLIKLLDLSFDTFNLLHRWLGRVIAVELLIHVFTWVAGAYYKGKIDTVIPLIKEDPFYYWGLISACPMILMVILAWSPIRRPFYEVFLHLHRAFAVLSVIGLYYHLFYKDYYEIKILFAVIAIWGAEHVARFLRNLYRGYGRTSSTAIVEVLPGEAMRITVQLARPWKVTPGQHVYMYMPSISPISSHPFSVAWHGSTNGPAQDPAERSDSDTKEGARSPTVTTLTQSSQAGSSSITLIARVCDGFTRQLWDAIPKTQTESGSKTFSVRCFLEGPYRGSQNDMDSYGSVVLFAGGVGVTHQLPFLQHLMDGVESGRVATRRMSLVWVVHTASHVEWAAEFLNTVLAHPRARELLRIHIFVSQPDFEGQGGRILLPGLVDDEAVEVSTGRPSPAVVLDQELAEHKAGAMGVTVCGPGGLSDEVRLAVRERQHLGTIDYVEESFSW